MSGELENSIYYLERVGYRNVAGRGPRFLSIARGGAPSSSSSSYTIPIRGGSILAEYPATCDLYGAVFRPTSAQSIARSRARSRSSRGRPLRAACYRTVMRPAALAIIRYHPSKFRGGCTLVSGVAQGSSRRREALRFVRVTSLRPEYNGEAGY